jgi:hypothetical protein
MAGMLVEAGGPTNRILSVDGGIMVTIGHDDHPVALGVDLWHVILPDLTDPATIGCLHHLVCEAYNAFHIRVQVSVAPDMSGRDHATWTAVDARGRILARGGFRTTSRVDLMADGLISALEAAP